MEFKITNKHLPILILLGVILMFILRSLFVSYGSIKSLKNDLKGNIKKVDSIEASKKELFDEIKNDSLLLSKKDSIILVLTNQKTSLKKSLKYYKNENKKLKGTYIDNPINKRIDIFTRLATEKDTIQ